jgi:hypothetical protein
MWPTTYIVVKIHLRVVKCTPRPIKLQCQNVRRAGVQIGIEKQRKPQGRDSQRSPTTVIVFDVIFIANGIRPHDPAEQQHEEKSEAPDV